MYASADWIWTQTLVRALMRFDIDEATARRALQRTAGEGWLERRKTGRRVCWRLSPSGQDLTLEARERVSSFRSGRTDWNHEWLFLLLTTRDDRTRNLARRRLAWAGFGWLSSDLAISPHVEREGDASRILEQLDLEAQAISFRATTGTIGIASHVITEAWDLDDVAERYAGFVRDARARRPRSDADMFAANTTLMHEWRRFIYVDPGLPLEFLPKRWIGIDARRVFERQHERWQPSANEWFAQLNAGTGDAGPS